MSLSDVSDPNYEVEQRVYIIPPPDPIPTLKGTIGRQPTHRAPYYVVISDAPADEEWHMVTGSIAPLD